jgi:hypothetical protein
MIRTSIGGACVKRERGNEGDGAEGFAEEAGQGDAALPAGGEGRKSDERVAANSAKGAARSDERDGGKDGNRGVGTFPNGGAGGDRVDHDAVAGPDGGGDGLQGGVWGGSIEWEDAGGVGGGAVVEGGFGKCRGRGNKGPRKQGSREPGPGKREGQGPREREAKGLKQMSMRHSERGNGVERWQRLFRWTGRKR